MAPILGALHHVCGVGQVGPAVAAFFGVAAALYAANRVAPWANYPNSLKAEYVAAENKARQQGHYRQGTDEKVSLNPFYHNLPAGTVHA